MSASWQGRLLSLWTALASEPTGQKEYCTKRLSQELTLAAYAAVRSADGAPCLLIHARISPSSLFELGGMRLSISSDNGSPLVVLSLEDRDRLDLFGLLCADVISVAEADEPDKAAGSLFERLDAWRRFLRERRTGLTHEDTIGLIGELLVLEKLLLLSPEAHQAWKSPDDALHDFVISGQAIEVKAALGPASIVRISSLDQLDISGLKSLHLIYVRMIESRSGRTLGSIIDDLLSSLNSSLSKRELDNALLRRGLMPDDKVARQSPRIEVRSVDAYSVVEDFPKLTRSAVPAPVSEAAYALDLRGLSGFSADTDVLISNFVKALSNA